MTDDQTQRERKSAPPRRRRARAGDADAEVNPPGEPSSRRVAPGWERRMQEMPGRKGTMKVAPWLTNEGRASEAVGDDEEDDDDEDFPEPGRPPSPGRVA